MTRRSLVLVAALAACGPVEEDPGTASQGAPVAGDPHDHGAAAGEPLVERRTPPVPLSDPRPRSADLCTDDRLPHEPFVETVRGPFTFRYFAGTAAERDLDAIAERRLAAYEAARAFFDVAERPSVTVELYPSRLAAVSRGRTPGSANWVERRISVVYTGVEGSFERVHYGHEVAHVIGHRMDHQSHLALVEEGLAVYLDGSGEDRHAAYARSILADAEPLPLPMDARDLRGRNYDKLGSLVAFLVERHGAAVVREIYRRAAVVNGGGQVRDLEGRMIDATTFDEWFDGVLRRSGASPWVEVRAAWQATVEAAVARERARSFAEAREIRALLRGLAAARAARDPDQYRAYMEGFYCDSMGEPARQAIARRMADGAPARLEVRAIQPTSIRNFPQAVVQIEDGDAAGDRRARSVWLERFASGWRVTWDPLWE